MMPRISFFTDSKPTSDRIETELRRRGLAYNRLAAEERLYSPLPAVQIGDTYLAGSRETNEYLFRLLDEATSISPTGRLCSKAAGANSKKKSTSVSLALADPTIPRRSQDRRHFRQEALPIALRSTTPHAADFDPTPTR
jgi:hypothetical protein